jgi:hypothetical protein
MLAVNTIKRPHLKSNHFAVQIGQTQWGIRVQPNGIGQLGGWALPLLEG